MSRRPGRSARQKSVPRAPCLTARPPCRVWTRAQFYATQLAEVQQLRASMTSAQLSARAYQGNGLLNLGRADDPLSRPLAKRDPAFPNTSDPNRVQLIRVFVSVVDNDSVVERLETLRQSKATLDYARLARLLQRSSSPAHRTAVDGDAVCAYGVERRGVEPPCHYRHLGPCNVLSSAAVKGRETRASVIEVALDLGIVPDALAYEPVNQIVADPIRHRGIRGAFETLPEGDQLL